MALTSASTRMETEVVGAISGLQFFSGKEAIVDVITTAITRPEQELLEINLRDGAHWWSTRLFLVVALSQDYSQTQQFVFVEQGEERLYIGTARPADERQAIAANRPTLEMTYHRIKRELPHLSAQAFVS